MIEAPDPEVPTGPTTPTSPSRMWLADWLLILTAAAAFGLDQLTKYIVRSNFSLGEAWPAGSFISLKYTTNSGSAFGLFPNQTTLLIIASFFAVGFLIYFYKTHARPRKLLRLAIGLQLGGAIGNLLDRIRDGTVVDFIDVGPWPTFNIADSSIVVGMAILVGLLTLWSDKAEDESAAGGRRRRARRAQWPRRSDSRPIGRFDGSTCS